jgi:hypothetical protein
LLDQLPATSAAASRIGHGNHYPSPPTPAANQ